MESHISSTKQPLYVGVSLKRSVRGDESLPDFKDVCLFDDEENLYMDGIETCVGVCYYALYLHDGFYSIDSSVHKCETHDQFQDDVYEHLEKYFDTYKVVLVAFDERVPISDAFKRKLWQDNDILPVTLKVANGKVTLEELACSAVRQALQLMAPATTVPTITNVQVGFRNRVEVDGDGKIIMTCTKDYQPYLSELEWQEVHNLVSWARAEQLKVVFINSTPRGGGVSLMRHALLRFFSHFDLPIDWYVMKPDPHVFEITKKKFHNVFQGVSHTTLSSSDKKAYEDWCERNVTKHWKGIKHDIVVIDDPQPAGTIPFLKKFHPSANIIYRNHIQIDDQLINEEGTAAHETFNYLYNNYLSQSEAIVNHPLRLPTILQDHKQLYEMPATTDPLDGLNKTMSSNDINWYLSHFQRMCLEHGQPVPNINVPWIVQIARFDPSKGILDVVKSFIEVHNMVQGQVHLVITGHGSIDDPEGSKIYHEVEHLVNNLSNSVRSCITVLRVPPSDQLLNVILRKSRVALQLSHKEGFEVKVTEAIMKGIPVIAYATGGIPHQIVHGRTGFLVAPRCIEDVTKYIMLLLNDEELYQTMSNACRESKEIYRHFLTPMNALKWLRIWKATYLSRSHKNMLTTAVE